jgi:hypothetical protein
MIIINLATPRLLPVDSMDTVKRIPPHFAVSIRPPPVRTALRRRNGTPVLPDGGGGDRPDGHPPRQQHGRGHALDVRLAGRTIILRLEGISCTPSPVTP